jgi:hypothetical protein
MDEQSRAEQSKAAQKHRPADEQSTDLSQKEPEWSRALPLLHARADEACATDWGADVRRARYWLRPPQTTKRSEAHRRGKLQTRRATLQSAAWTQIMGSI